MNKQSTPWEKPRSGYVMLTEEEIEHVRSVYKRYFSDGARLDTVCDMAINCLLYADEINRLRSAPSAREDIELLQASRDVVKWLDSPEVKDTFKQMGALSSSHPHLAIRCSQDFSLWAMKILQRFRNAVS